MPEELLDLYRRAADWSIGKIAGVDDLTAPTPCDQWDVRTLLNHMLETQRYFAAAARGEQVPFDPASPAQLLSDDPVRDFEAVRDEMLASYADPAVVESHGFGLTNSIGDFLVHGWDVARATGQDATMPAGIPTLVYDHVAANLNDEVRGMVFKPEVSVPDDADEQTKLLAYSGRNPD